MIDHAFITPLALRGWIHELDAPVGVTDGEPEDAPEEGGHPADGRHSRIGARVFVFDCETTVDELQMGRFGFARLYARGRLVKEILFTADDLETADLERWAIIRSYADGHGLLLMTRRDFTHGWLYPEVWGAGALLVGFNLPFDISRVAADTATRPGCAIARGRHRDGFSFRLTGDYRYPSIRIKPLASHSAMIDFTRPRQTGHDRLPPFDGRFLDLHTLVYALTGEAHSLASAGAAFDAEVVKAGLDDEAHGGPITAEYLDYARQDVEATYSLYLRLRDVYQAFPFATNEPEKRRQQEDTPITKLYSPASIAKAFLRKMGLQANRDTVAPAYLGYAMAAFYGGRIECRLRKTKVPATLLDFSSQYPAVFTLLNLWPWVSADRLEIREDDGGDVRRLLEEIAGDPNCLLDPATWPRLAGYAQVLPDGDFLPSRAPWGVGESDDLSKVALAVAPLTSSEPMWYALPDLAGSAALTGRAGEVLRAFRVVPVGRQELRSVRLGDATIDPGDPALFAKMVAERHRLKDAGQTPLATGVKGIANTGCYGIWVEFNRQMLESEEATVKAVVYSERAEEKTFHGQIERPGRYTNPLIGALVTAGGRLLLALAQREAEQRGGHPVWTATDAICVTGLPAETVAQVQARLRPLSPFCRQAVPEFLKREETGTAYAIAANRYVMLGDDGSIIRASLHGMSGIIPPDDERLKEFARKVWQAVLSGEIPYEWTREPLRRVFPIRKPRIWDRARDVCAEIRPFGFLQTAAPPKNIFDRRDCGARSVYGPYFRDARRSLLGRRWWDGDGRKGLKVIVAHPSPEVCTFTGKQEIAVESVAAFVGAFAAHPEVKMAGLVGSLVPRPVARCGSYVIGKETDPITDGSAEYAPEDQDGAEVLAGRVLVGPHLLGCVRKLEKWPDDLVARALDLGRTHWWNIRKGVKAPGWDTRRVILRLARRLPETPPRGREEQRAVLAGAAERARLAA